MEQMRPDNLMYPEYTNASMRELQKETKENISKTQSLSQLLETNILYNHCAICGKPLFQGQGTTTQVEICSGHEPQPPLMRGWVCPKCGSGLSPFTSRCPCVPMPFNITY